MLAPLQFNAQGGPDLRFAGILVTLAMSLALLVCALSPTAASTTGIISGCIKSQETGAPLSGVNVFVNGTVLSTVTDANGRFSFTNVPPGDYEVRAELVGYGVSTLGSVSVTMDSTAAADMLLKQEATEEQTVVVTRPRPMVTPDIVNTLSQVTADQESLTRIDPANVRTATGLLSALPGVTADTDGSGQVHVRGGRADQIGWYIEGIPITDPNTGMFGTNLYTTGINKFQAFTGGFSAEYGNAISGVLNEVKKTGASANKPRLDMEYGNQAYWNTFAELGGGEADRFNFYVGGAMFRSDLDAPLVTNQEYTDGVAKLVWPSKDNTVSVLALRGKLTGYLDAYHDTGDNGAATPHEKDFMDQRYSVNAVTWSHNFSPKTFMTVQPYYMDLFINQNIVGMYGTYADISSKRAGLQVGYTSELSDRHLLKTGWSYLGSNNHYYLYPGFPYYQADVDSSQNAAYIEDQVKLTSKWTANLGVRRDSMTYDRTGQEYVLGAGYSGASVPDVTVSRTTPRCGMSYAQDSRTVWKASWGKYTKFVPAYTVQRTYVDPDLILAPGYPTLEGMTASLGSYEPQSSQTWELSYEKQVSQSMAWRVTPFYTSYANLGDLYLDMATGAAAYANLGEGKSTGVEMSLRKKMSDNWQGWVSYTYQKTKSNRADLGLVTDMYYAPWDQRHSLSLVTEKRSGRYTHNIRADYGSGRADRGDPTLQQRANASVVVSYTANYKLPEGSTLGDSIYLSVFNVFNNHQAMQYRWDPGPARVMDSWVPSRTLSLGISSTF